MGHVIVQGLLFGDEGKGTIVDAICASRAIEAVIRYNGGCQAGHNVVTNDGLHHEFSQFGSGTLQGVRTILSRHVLVDPLAIGTEASHLKEIGVHDPLSLLEVSAYALVVTPYHARANQLRESRRGSERHGSCGRGIGETVEYEMMVGDDALRIGDLISESRTRKKLDAILHYYEEEFGPTFGNTVPHEQLINLFVWFPSLIKIASEARISHALVEGDCVFEGAQGVLLDETHGFAPYNTWSNTTFENALQMLSDVHHGREVERVGVTRAYATRHGKGPLPTEDADLTEWLADANNPTNDWQGGFRVGHLDVELLRYASRVCGGMDSVAITHLDRVQEQSTNLLVCNYYTNETLEPLDPELTAKAMRAKPALSGPDLGWSETIVAGLGVPCSVESFGPRAGDKEFHADL